MLRKCESVSRSTLCDSMDCSLPGSSIHRILQARMLEWLAILFFKGFSWPRDQTLVSCLAGRSCTIWAGREALECLNEHLVNTCYMSCMHILWCSYHQEVESRDFLVVQWLRILLLVLGRTELKFGQEGEAQCLLSFFLTMTWSMLGKLT